MNNEINVLRDELTKPKPKRDRETRFSEKFAVPLAFTVERERNMSRFFSWLPRPNENSRKVAAVWWLLWSAMILSVWNSMQFKSYMLLSVHCGDSFQLKRRKKSISQGFTSVDRHRSFCDYEPPKRRLISHQMNHLRALCTEELWIRKIANSQRNSIWISFISLKNTQLPECARRLHASLFASHRYFGEIVESLN